jgi:hypothetical protein
MPGRGYGFLRAGPCVVWKIAFRTFWQSLQVRMFYAKCLGNTWGVKMIDTAFAAATAAGPVANGLQSAIALIGASLTFRVVGRNSRIFRAISYVTLAIGVACLAVVGIAIYH